MSYYRRPFIGASPFLPPNPFGVVPTGLPSVPFDPSQSPGGTVPMQASSLPSAFSRWAHGIRTTSALTPWERIHGITQRGAQANALAQAYAAGYTTPIRCGTFSAFHCTIYALVELPGGAYDLQVGPRPQGGATNLFANLAGKQMVHVVNMGAVNITPVAWLDAPGGPVWGYMLEGGFET